MIAFIDASIDYQVSHCTNNIALIEIIFNGRTEDIIQRAIDESMLMNDDGFDIKSYKNDNEDN